MTDEQAVRASLYAASKDPANLSYVQSTTESALALLDAKDVEISSLKRELDDCRANMRAKIDEVRWAANAETTRAEQAEAEADRLAKALIKTQGELNCAEAELAEERKEHQAFREEVSEACHNARYYAGDGEFLNLSRVKRILSRFILPAKPADPLVGVAEEAIVGCTQETAKNLREILATRGFEIIERAGGVKAVFGEG